ncbi:DUF3891 family protein [Oceanobacillus luteolus]|uniref:DUF3891 family protein n=1 Tax=Oceanobacillus luteolus TaxID=1274358 RepID=A0ABW4HSG4_9BACI
MIIREQEENFLMIRQHDHAIISEQMTMKLKKGFLPDDDWQRSVLYAIKMHDFGWSSFDAEPLWNDEKQIPYSFIDYPDQIKTILYKHGIDEVAKEDPYAGLLCSKHYANFLAHDPSPEATRFVINEENRQKSIQEEFRVDHELVASHFELLQFADNLSLFLCLNEPGAGQEEFHYFFKKGIPFPKHVEEQFGERLHLEWIDKHTIGSEKSPFQETFTVSIPFKKVSKAEIAKKGIRKSYNEAVEEIFSVYVKGD